MDKISNKDLVQSYIMTTAKYDFNVYEKRVIYRLVEMAQAQLQGLKFPADCCKIEHKLKGCVDITMPIAGLLDGEDDKNHSRVKQALQSLQKKIFVYEDDRVWESISIIVWPVIEKYASTVSFKIHDRVWDCILDFSKGYRKYELKVAMSFKSQYAMRFYELLSGQKSPLTYSLVQLKEMFCVSDKYKQTNDFVKYVVDAAKKELDEKSPYSFEYEYVKSGRKVTALTFHPKYQPEHQDEELEKKRLQKRTSLSWDLEKPVIDYLRHGIGFTDKEIKLHRDLFIDAQNCLDDFLQDLAILKAKSRDKANPKGWVISAIRGKVDDVLKNH